MHYAVPLGHAALSQLVELSDEIASEHTPRGARSAAEVAEMIMRGAPGAPEPTLFDVIALVTEDQDLHVLLARREDGVLARASFIEGEDLCDDIDVFEFVTDQNRDIVLRRFERWCEQHLESEDEQAYRALVSDLIGVEEKKEDMLTADLLMVSPTLAQLESLVGQVRTEALRDAISDALVAIKAAAR